MYACKSVFDFAIHCWDILYGYHVAELYFGVHVFEAIGSCLGGGNVVTPVIAVLYTKTTCVIFCASPYRVSTKQEYFERR